MRTVTSLLLSGTIAFFGHSNAAAQTPAPPNPGVNVPSGPVSAPIAANERFYPRYKIEPIGNGEKVLITLDLGTQQLNIVAEPLPAKDGGEVKQWAVFTNGGGTIYTKKFITIPGPDGVAGSEVEGISVTRLSAPEPASAAPPATPPVRPAQSAHQSTSLFTTPPHKSANFRMPIRFEKVGFGTGQPRIWLMWDGKTEIWVQPVETKFKESLWMIPAIGGDISHLKFLENAVVQGSPAPRYFYLKRNRDDSMTIYGDDDLDKLKAIEKGKDK